MKFKLSEKFVDGYKSKKPPFGFNGLGELVYRRTYSRIKTDGSNEEWYETVERVINGTYNMQKEHIEKYSLGWNSHKAQKSAQEMYDRMFNMKFLPPGRGLWAMGSQIIEEKKLYAALNNPLGLDTLVLTKEYGWIKIGDIKESTITILTNTKLYGRDDSINATAIWKESTLSNIELQPCIEIKYVSKFGDEYTTIASKNHRWFRRKNTYAKWERVTTEELNIGDWLPRTKPQKTYKISKQGIEHGYFFGDGTRSNGELHQFGKNTSILKKLFNNVEDLEPIESGESHSVVRQCPLAWALIPNRYYIDDNRYIYGFLAGYFAADGSLNTSGRASICSSRKEELESVALLFNKIGIRTLDVKLLSTESNFKEERVLYELVFDTTDVDEDFFIFEEHREIFKDKHDNKQQDWLRITEMKDVGFKHVRCVSVEYYEQFVINGFCLTSNCSFVSTENIKDDPSKPFCFLMDASMLGVGVGFDTKGAGTILIKGPDTKRTKDIFIITDDREGWVESLSRLLESHFYGIAQVEFDYGKIRKAGEPIKTFGGTSSGHEPLKQMHDTIRDILAKEAGQMISMTNIVDIMNVIGKCVVSGNVRRSAEIVFGEANDEDYLDLKDYTKNPRRQEFGWASNNSVVVKVGANYKKASERTRINGEPGYFWLDNARSYGRMGDAINNKDSKSTGCNPCLVGDTWILTSNGPRKINELINIPFIAIVNGTPRTSHKGFWSTGIKEVFQIQTSRGYIIEATDNHKFHILSHEADIWREVKDLSVGQKIALSDHRFHINQNQWGSINNRDEDIGWLLGSLVGDGTFASSGGACLDYWGSTAYDMANIAYNRINAHLENHHDVTILPQLQEEKFHIHCKALADEGKILGITKDNKKITDAVEKQSALFYKGFLRGLFDADGSVQGTQSKGVSVRLNQSDLELLKRAQRMLSRLGILSTIYENRRSAGFRLLPDGKGGEKEYYCIDNHELVISGHNLQIYFDLIGFDDSNKMSRLSGLLAGYKRSLNFQSYEDEIISIKSIGQKEVFDTTIEEVHEFCANGFRAHNCVEQTLESYELCCVSKDTPLQTRLGIRQIIDTVGKSIEIWNGDNWSQVVPFLAGSNKTLYRVTISDGSYLDCTNDHKWSVRSKTGKVYKQVETQNLYKGDIVAEFDIDKEYSGVYNENAYEWGLFAGDGYIDKNYPMLIVCGDKKKLINLGIKGRLYKEQIKEGYTDPVNRINLVDYLNLERATELNDKTKGLPIWVSQMDKTSLLEFIAGYIETDGNVCHQENTDNYRIFGTEKKMRDMQLLLRRVGINHSSIYCVGEEGEETNFGIRNYALWCCYIPSYECSIIPTRIKIATRFGSRYKINNAYPESIIDAARNQKIVSVEELPGLHNTYCFSEPVNHMGVFGNVITYQCLVESFPDRHDNLEDYKRTLKFAYLYAKTVTLGNTHWPETNRVMLRNRRIGCSVSGVAQFLAKNGIEQLRVWLEDGYKTIQEYDENYSNWLCIPRSIKTTSVKPSGSVSLLAGATPGMHFPESRFYIRRVRMSKNSTLIEPLRKAGYVIEPASGEEEQSVAVEIPVDVGDGVRVLKEVSMWEQLALAAFLQKYWSDNQVSSTITFDPATEGPQIEYALNFYQYQLKGISFLPRKEYGAYKQMPYEAITEEQFKLKSKDLKKVNFKKVTNEKANVEVFCDGDTCTFNPGIKKEEPPKEKLG